MTPTSTPTRAASQVWGFPFVLGLLLALLGVITIALAPMAGAISVIFLGAVLVVAGLVEIVHAFRKEGAFVLRLLGGIFSGVVGALIVVRPGAGMAALTLLVAGYLFANGLFRVITSIADRHADWGLDLAYGILALVLGVAIVARWPASSLLVVGAVVGVEILARGAVLMGASLRLRRLVRQTSHAA